MTNMEDVLYDGSLDIGVPQRGSGLGFLINPGTVAAGVSLFNTLTHDPKDAQRFAKNTEAYQAAVSGDQLAMEFLKYRSGRFGEIASLGRWGGPVGGWATAAAKDDAWKRYNAALGAWGLSPEETGSGYGGVATSQPGGDGVHAQGLPGVSVQAKQSYTPLLIVGGVVAAYMLTRRR